MTDDDDLEERERELSADDALEAGRTGERIERPDEVGPVIGGKLVVRADVRPAPAVRCVWRCASCNHLVSDWHACPDPDPQPVDAEIWAETGNDYHDTLGAIAHRTRLDKWLEWGPDEWRAIPGYPNFQMHGYTREVRRRAYSLTLKSGVVRNYPEREVKAHRSSVTLSNESGARAWGIEKLWKLTFREYSLNVYPMRRKENIPAELGRVIDIRR